MQRTAVLFTAAASLALAACTPEDHVVGEIASEQEQEQSACPDYEPGNNMLDIVWNAIPEENAKVADLVQIAGDSEAASTRVVAELYDACIALASVVGEGPQADDAPTLDQTRNACTSAIAGVATLRARQENLTATITASPSACATATAIAECRADCDDGTSCSDYCSSAVAWMADCPAAAVDITFDGEVDPGLVGAWSAVESAVGRVLAARTRLGLANQTFARLAFAPSGAYSLDRAACFSVLFQSMTDTTEANATCNQVIGDLLRTIEVVE